MRSTKPSMSAGIVLIFLIALAAPVAASALNQASSNNPTINKMPIRIDSKVEQDPASVVAAFDSALNAHDVTAGLDLFADNGFVHDLAREVYSANLPYNMMGSTAAATCSLHEGAVCAYSGKDKIGDWLQQLALENIQVKETGTYQVSGDSVTWSLGVSIDGYRNVGIAPLPEIGQATVQGGKIQSLTLSLTSDSVSKLTAAFAKSGRGQVSILTGGFLTGIVALGLIFPAAAMYYISRVRSLFAAIPRLERPWILLLAGVGSLFLATLLILLRGFAPIPSWDAIYSVVLVVAAFFILASMVLMKRVWTIAGGE